MSTRKVLTKLEAKELTLEVWRYLSQHGEAWTKSVIPVELYSKIENMMGRCPLCEYHYVAEGEKANFCDNCPLGPAVASCNYYDYWIWANGEKAKETAAQKIVDLVEAWEVEE